MKNLKILLHLVFTLVVFVSCEKEIIDSQELQQLNSQKEKGLNTGINSGEGKPISAPNFQKSTNLNSQKILEENGASLYFSQQTFDNENCLDLITEDFEPSITPENDEWSLFSNPLKSSKEKGIYAVGDILDGVTIRASNEYDDIALVAIQTSENNYSVRPAWSNDYDDQKYKLIIKFDSDYINAVNMDIKRHWYNGDVIIKVFGESGLIVATNLYSFSSQWSFIGMKSNEPIKKIVINAVQEEGFWGWEYIDNLSFGTDMDQDGTTDDCDNCPNIANEDQNDFDRDEMGDACDDDDDNDGRQDGKDLVQFSDLRREINIDNCWTSIQNMEVKRGMYMQDEINKLINEIEAIRDISNQMRSNIFKQKMYFIVSNWWYKYKLIDNNEKNTILECVGNASYPFNDEPT